MQEVKDFGGEREIVEDIRAVEPLLYESRASRYIAILLRDVRDHEEIEMEFTFLMNAAVIRFSVDFCEQDRVLALTDKVKGAINIGFEKLSNETKLPVKELYLALGLGKIYRLGFAELMALRAFARKASPEKVEEVKDRPEIFSTLACAREAFPEMPLFLKDDGTVEARDGGSISQGQRAIESLQAVSSIRSIIAKVL